MTRNVGAHGARAPTRAGQVLGTLGLRRSDREVPMLKAFAILVSITAVGAIALAGCGSPGPAIEKAGSREDALFPFPFFDVPVCGIDCSAQSSGDNGAASASVVARIDAYARASAVGRGAGRAEGRGRCGRIGTAQPTPHGRARR